MCPEIIITGSGATSYFVGNYISRADIDPPNQKKKTLHQRVKEKLIDLLPETSPVPLPAKYT
ncbi:hypothetical protein H6501_00920 [Candidatus Woesearchaeota archaeon]|nr:hypothetical protein [Nanoarchaeota archaeon]MCB9370139.1 hypothetical protein [Candidatus Woesearchaeota archaeon]USN44669.1 MAG: hypothetical protein H6500_02395 [Candidatus Woesearchaeota archaeon]